MLLMFISFIVLFLLFLCFSVTLPTHKGSVLALSLAHFNVREESPGSIGRPASENRSYW